MKVGFEWFVAWRYLRERGRRASFVPLGTGVAFLLLGAVLLVIGNRMKTPHPADIAAGMTNWKQIYQGGGLGAIVVGVLVSVFGYLYILQSIFTTISTFGVFLGTWALVIALSVMNGFEVDLRQKILGSNAHIQVSKDKVSSFTGWREIDAKLDAIPGIVSHSPYLSSEVVIAANSNYSGMIIKGVLPQTYAKVTDLAQELVKPDEELAQLWPLAPDGGVMPYTLPDGGIGPDAAPDNGDIDAGPPADAGPEEPPPDFSGGSAEDETDAGPHHAAEQPTADNDEPPKIFDGSEYGDAGPEPLAHALPVDDFDEDIVIPGPFGPIRPKRKLHLDARVAGLDGIIVGAELVKNLHLWRGTEVQVVSPLGQDTPTGQIPRVKNFRVAGSFKSGMYEYDTKYGYVTLPALQRFLSMGDEVNGIEIKVSDYNDTAPVMKAIRDKLGPGWRVQDWKELNRNLFSALKLEKIAMFLVLTIIILVASFSIISNLIMVVVEKAREIAILKGMGAADGGIMRVFMIEGLYIGLLGTAFGITLGVTTCWAMKRFGLPLNPDVYYIDKLPVAMDPFAIVLVAAAGVAISFIATIYPSFVAARLRPVDGLRNE